MEEDNVTYDYERLRADLLDFFDGAFFVGHFGAASFDRKAVEQASDEELLLLAQSVGFPLSDYIIPIFVR